MAATKTKKPRIRKETTRSRPETTNRETKIKMLIGAGMGNKAVWAALENEYPEIIHEADERRDPDSSLYEPDLPPYDEDQRGKVSRAINSTRRLEIKDDERVMSIVEACGGDAAKAKTLDQMDMLNRHRFSWNIPALDYIYGETRFMHLMDHPDSQYRDEETTFKQRDENGVPQRVTKQRRIWVSGSWKAGDPMIPDGNNGWLTTRDEHGDLLDLDERSQYVEHGCPESFMSIWGGEPGVGKTKLACDAGKAVNRVTEEPILYINGEDSEENFRMKIGNDAHPDLFRVLTANMLPVDRICQLAYEIRPRIIFIDSVQTIAEWDKGNRGQKSALMILRNLMMEKRAGTPHIVLISQLNKQGDLKGARDLEHLADFVAQVTKVEGRKGVFQFECPRKNRGGETPRGALFQHLRHGVRCVSSGDVADKTPSYKLLQPNGSTVTEGIATGIIDPEPAKADGGADISIDED